VSTNTTTQEQKQEESRMSSVVLRLLTNTDDECNRLVDFGKTASVLYGEKYKISGRECMMHDGTPPMKTTIDLVI